MKVRREGRADEQRHDHHRPPGHDRHAVPARGPEHPRGRARHRARRADARQQPRRHRGGRRAREPARAPRLGRAARRRAHVAQPVEVRRRRRSRPLHDFAPAREARRHADQSALAHRFPDARVVLGEDQRLRSDHLRPLPASRPVAASLLRQHRALRRGAWRRAARCRRRRLRRQPQPVPHAAVAGAAGRADRAACCRSRSRPRSPTTAASIP